MHYYFLLYKPHGYLSQFVYQSKKKKKVLGELYSFPAGTMAVGRLDENSEGLLLLTTDGKWSMEMRSQTVEKEYFVQVDGDITVEALQTMSQGVEIGIDGKKYLTNRCLVTKVVDLPDCIKEGKKIRDERHGPTSWVKVVLNEGKNRQIRKMTAAVGFPTLRLIRTRIGVWSLEGLNIGGVKQMLIIF